MGVNGASTMSAIAFGGILYSLAKIIIGIDSANVIFFHGKNTFDFCFVRMGQCWQLRSADGLRGGSAWCGDAGAGHHHRPTGAGVFPRLHGP